MELGRSVIHGARIDDKDQLWSPLFLDTEKNSLQEKTEKDYVSTQPAKLLATVD